jgi:hypothetical protein
VLATYASTYHPPTSPNITLCRPIILH